ncbi:hypothetical protein SASPL_142814 [Salvia splendens]|uniref:CCHC-type domain-containing protein n=1 Tax=Salvia splendens TaxID=180675 RepID=A0A8X8ZA81_SALSN|nr:hypothetical protein SASPL_142814 [Salvia splendens]
MFDMSTESEFNDETILFSFNKTQRNRSQLNDFVYEDTNRRDIHRLINKPVDISTISVFRLINKPVDISTISVFIHEVVQLGPIPLRGASPEEYVRAYQTYQRCYGDSLGEFLAHYQRLWWDAAFHGSVTGCDGIVRLLSLLPDGWREWATMVADKYIVTAYPAYDLVGDFPRFLLAVFTRFVCYGSVSPLLIDSPAPEEAARKGKAHATDPEGDGEEGPPVVAPVGSSRLQAITVPSSCSHIRSATEADHPNMGRRMVRVDTIWPHLRKAENEAVPPALTDESVEDPHLLWEWACGEDENNPILVNSDDERGPKGERSSDSDSDINSEDILDCGYYTPSGKWVWPQYGGYQANPGSFQGNVAGPSPCPRCNRLHGGTCKAGADTCFNCGRAGHFAKNCPSKNSGTGVRPNPSAQRPQLRAMNVQAGSNSQQIPRNQQERPKLPTQARAYAMRQKQPELTHACQISLVQLGLLLPHCISSSLLLHHNELDEIVLIHQYPCEITLLIHTSYRCCTVGRPRLVAELQAAVLLNGAGSVEANRRASVAMVAGRAHAPGVVPSRCAAGADAALMAAMVCANIGGRIDESCRGDRRGWCKLEGHKAGLDQVGEGTCPAGSRKYGPAAPREKRHTDYWWAAATPWRPRLVAELQAAVLLNGAGSVEANRRASVAMVASQA